MRTRRLALPLLFSVLLGACASAPEEKPAAGPAAADKSPWYALPDWSIPGVYKIDIQQGNVLEQRQVNQLRPGMSRNQVRITLGTPLLVDTFHQERWDYLYSFQPGKGEPERRRLSLYFKDDRLARIEGDLRPENEDEARKTAEKNLERAVLIPADEPKPDDDGIFRKLLRQTGLEKKEE